ncbi:Uncharacterized protein AArcCO_2901 [Halalkaliarchaeum sp. AArc-CO]|uniref:DUF5789 family protein n=1 Tax=unclassified Halalkaliarchaeum TaxID=2678344 RepID=UPI00217D8936|nr:MULTISPECIES: DUF2795 domain-containing protein [unclassified Halalkaliarchaeum]MDR5674613.1 DUF2795 domain-containing protein [Halalkaliarchaeum sp. AArc-GB]UWG52175.1 Uncharacterized protein AArcCO_2901 [Halalkaliarchaeum sp. AArc-CO]
MRLNGTGDKLDTHEYPATREEIIEAYGDRSIELPNGTETLGSVLERIGDETYEDAADARTAVFTGVGYEAVGRRFYSDRDPTALGEDGPEPVSF